jgi:5-hydroxyisourate hydrolase-like protein (transthyretin family)
VHALNRIFRSLSALLIFLPVAALAAAPITGTVMNRTTSKPAAGDDVTLLNLVQGMQEVAHSTTNAKGQFSLEAGAGGQYLLRVTHDMASYYESVPAGTQTVDVDVYSSGAHVAGVSTEVLMLRAQTDAGGANLDVTEDFVVKNASKPPMTQYSKEPFNLYLPAGAVVEATAAKGPKGMPTAEDLTPLAEKGLYTVLFPIRPGETQIEVAYHIPYTGSLKLSLKMAGQTDMFAVSVPKSMTFTPGTDGQFIPANGDVSALTYVARGLKTGQGVAFGVGGSGQLPRDTQGSDQGGQGQAGMGGGSGSGAAEDNAPGKGLGVPLDPNGTHEPLSTKYKWWILGGLGLVLVAAAGVLLRKPTVAPAVAVAAARSAGPQPVVARSVPAVAATPAGRQEQLLQVLKEELFGLETDRLQGHIDEADYAQSKAAIELILRRALARGAAAGSAPPTGSAV